jgi:ABC-type nitrate/sulfonate/bicarbonate transport system permease component
MRSSTSAISRLEEPAAREDPGGDTAGRASAGTVWRAARSVLLAALVPAVLIGCWQAAVTTGLVSAVLVPSPAEVAAALARFVAGDSSSTLPGVAPFDGAWWLHMSASLRRLVLAYVPALGAGICLGTAIGLSTTVRRLLDPTVQGLRAIPVFAWLPLAIVWFGLGTGSARAVIFLGAVFPILVSTADAVARVPGRWLEHARALGTSWAGLLPGVVLPAALPGIVTGARLGLSLGWMSLIVGELTGTRTGVGAMMSASREAGRLDQIVVGMLAFAVLGLCSDLLLRAATRPLTRWSLR